MELSNVSVVANILNTVQMPSLLTTSNSTSNRDMDTKSKLGNRRRSNMMKPSTMNRSKENITPRLNYRISNSQTPPRGRANTMTSVALRTPKVAAVKTKKRSKSKKNSYESLRTPVKAMKVKSRNHRQGPLHERKNYSLIMSSPKLNSPRKREHIFMDDALSRCNAPDPWDMHSLASGIEEDVGHDRYSSIEQSPVKKRKDAISSFFDKGNSILSPIANPLHRFPPRVMQPRKNMPMVRIRPSNIIGRKEQVKGDIAVTLARMKVDDPGNVNYDGMPSTKSNKLQQVSHYNGAHNKNLKSFKARPKQIFIKNSDETEQMNNTSPLRMSRRRALMDRNANTLPPTSTKAGKTAPTYVYVGPSDTCDDEITFYSNGSGIINTVGGECTELSALNNTICIGLESGVGYATESTHARGEELMSDMAKNAAQMEGQMVEEVHALGEIIGNDCEGITGSSYEAANSLMMQMAKQHTYILGAGRDTCGAIYESDRSNEQTEATEKRGTFMNLRDAIKRRKEKWFDTVNNAYQMEGETVDEVHAFGEKIGKDCEGIAEFSYEGVDDSVLSQISKDNFLRCAGGEFDGTTDIKATQRFLDELSCDDEDTSEV